MPYAEGQRLPGAFSSGRIGNVLASFAPIVFEAVRRSRRRWWWSPVLLAPFLMTILLSGTRTAWVALAMATIGYLLLFARWPERPSADPRKWSPARIVATSGALVLAAALAAWTVPGLGERVWKTAEHRVEPLAGLWSGDRERIELALSLRLSIWETAAEHVVRQLAERGGAARIPLRLPRIQPGYGLLPPARWNGGRRKVGPHAVARDSGGHGFDRTGRLRAPRSRLFGEAAASRTRIVRIRISLCAYIGYRAVSVRRASFVLRRSFDRPDLVDGDHHRERIRECVPARAAGIAAGP